MGLRIRNEGRYKNRTQEGLTLDHSVPRTENDDSFDSVHLNFLGGRGASSEGEDPTECWRRPRIAGGWAPPRKLLLCPDLAEGGRQRGPFLTYPRGGHPEARPSSPAALLTWRQPGPPAPGPP